MSSIEIDGNHAFWNRVLERLSRAIPPASFDTWFRPLRFSGLDGNLLRLRAPNNTFRQWLLESYSDLLARMAAEVAGAQLALDISVDNTSDSDRPTAPMLPVVRAAALQGSVGSHSWLIDQLWTDQAVGVVGGSPKSGKTWLALEIAVSVASGTSCLGTFSVRAPGPVLLYAAEDSAAAVRARLETLARVHALDFEHLDVRVITADTLRLDRPDDQDRLAATVAAHRPALLVLDPLVRVHAIDENVAGQVAALLAYLRSLQRQTGAAIALIHHVRKNVSPASGAGYSLRGSSDLYAWLDSFLYLRKHHDQLTLTAEHRSASSFGPVSLQLAQPNPAGTHLELVAGDRTPTPPAADTLASRIFDLLSAASEPTTVENLRSRLQVRNGRVVDALRQLASQGKVQRLARGYTVSSNLPLETR
jgi:hypothetical protein